MGLRRLSAAVVLLGLLAGGCGGVPEADTTVVLSEMAIDVELWQSMGRSVWEVRNVGQAHHNLTICPGDPGTCVGEAVTQDVLAKPADARDPDALPDSTDALVLGSGSVTTVAVDLEPGRYRLYCAVPNHAAKGMEAIIKVR
jgi:plastocyanin